MRFVRLFLMWIAVVGALASGVPGRAGAQTAVMAAAPEAVVRRWAGSYVYEDALGEIPAGSGTRQFVTYRLRIPTSGSLPVTVAIVGFQSDERLRCAISGIAERVEVRFVSFADRHVVNRFGVAVYEPNALLFTLDRQNGSAELVTEWKALKPDGVAHRQGRYLEAATSL